MNHVDDSWTDQPVAREDIIDPSPLKRLRALFDHEPRLEQSLPPLGHWLFFLPDAKQSELGDDGHPKLGSDLPDLGLPRRMWAGSRIYFDAEIAVGDPVRRVTTIKSVRRKQGASGPLAFVTLNHEIFSGERVAIREEQDLVYREAAVPGAPAPRPREATVSQGETCLRRLTCDARLLFRFSALTFNAHRIHYDRDYARHVEGYPALVVHGPLQAMLLMDLFVQTFPDRSVRSFEFRAESPLFDNDVTELHLKDDAEGTSLWTQAVGGKPSVRARIC